MRFDLRFLQPFLLFILAAILFLFVSRTGLVLWQGERVDAVGDTFYIFLQGLRFDLVLLGLLLFIPLSITPLVLTSNRLLSAWRVFITLYLTICFVAIAFLELSTPSFINQYDLRPNRLYVEYLKYPKEVLATLWEGYRFQLIFTTLFSVVSFRYVFRWLKKSSQNMQQLHWLVAIALVPVLFLATVMMARSTLDHRAVNPSTVAFSSDPMVNTLPLNSAYSVIYASAEMMNEKKSTVQYGEMPEEEIMAIVKREMQVPAEAFVDDATSTWHHRPAMFKRERPLNFVIILEESLGAEFVGSLGGLPLTPEIDALTKEGLWFNNLYATGTRSVRGIEAVITSFTPTPLRSVVKLSKSQRNFFTVAGLLKEKGYDTSFIYGGEAHFDNMKRFFANNGFDHIVDENDFKNPVFYGSWGVSDEDLLNRAHERYAAMPEDKPFFSLVFTSSNHEPFEFPDGRIELYDEEKQTVNNAVKYADYAVGEFFRKAKKSKYWDNTLFLVVADHNSRVYGPDLVPIERFHIPALMLGGVIEPQVYNKLASQIDLLPTALSIMGIDADYPVIGHDLNRTAPERAIMQFASTQAYMKADGRVVVMQKNRKPEQYQYKNNHLLKSAEKDEALVKTALAHSIWTLQSYLQKRYQMTPPAINTAGDSAAKAANPAGQE